MVGDIFLGTLYEPTLNKILDPPLPGLNENWSNKAINLSKESETKEILCNTFMVPLCTKHRDNGVIKKHSYINAVHIICIAIYINKLGLLINKSVLLRNPVRAPFQELLVVAAIPGAHGGQRRQVPEVNNPVKPRANRPNMLANICPTCWDGLTCQTAPTSKNDEIVGEMLAVSPTCWRDGQHVGKARNIHVKPSQHVGATCWDGLPAALPLRHNISKTVLKIKTKYILPRNPVRAPFQELLVGAARPGSH